MTAASLAFHFRRFTSLLANSTSVLSRIMSTHLERTNGNTREPEVENCTVSSISDISSTVKLLQLAPERPVTFKPGQWVDFFIPRTDMVGGYSLCSDPRSPNLELAVKYSTHPPAHWVHKTCKTGEKVQVRVGGDVFLETDSGIKVVLLIAGGIGINPLLSMIRAGVDTETKYHLLYSAATVEELIFFDDLEKLKSSYDNVTVEYFITKETVKSDTLVKMNRERISPDAVNKLVSDYKSRFDESDMRCFLCGPPPMIDLLSKEIKMKCEYEKWW